MWRGVRAEYSEEEELSEAMKRFIHISAGILSVVVLCPAWGEQGYDPAAKAHTNSREGFIDFELNQINPRNIDYSCQIEVARSTALHETIGRIDSWAVLVATTLLILSFLMLLHQRNEASRCEVLAAQFLAQYHNALVDAREQVKHAIRHNRELRNKMTGFAEICPAATPAKPNLKVGAAESNTAGSSPAIINTESDGGGASASGQRSNTGKIIPASVDLLGQVRTLQQQLSAAHEREKKLQKQLSRSQHSGSA